MQRFHRTEFSFALLFIKLMVVGFTLGTSIGNIPTNPACPTSGCVGRGGGSPTRPCLSIYECPHPGGDHRNPW
ncbi:hypothetical protein PGT21_027984 [Puccinia graminis f. sp. tritici]|uniref:Uncharacterized protein n=1 Tax=Puccinia graminis f. sp. tritici TaxID=56615 RepID=A0A5B0RVH6_PUCGR|nr:hypothetical protein PGT21_027984 [Puccinia graminis f. sp. tritici]KAA1097008.1 hypothetical protein PGTUg99_002191 [Puccinia graminis f. sp. tritici]KAA1129790.1 hypothetical protein PGTUg99_002201 [Puccinia graminis f. sp. tritici]KAA1135076.1 hypothetical protein PGTUg99_022865 [Puccinia graminis f. sp. tritici]